MPESSDTIESEEADRVGKLTGSSSPTKRLENRGPLRVISVELDWAILQADRQMADALHACMSNVHTCACRREIAA